MVRNQQATEIIRQRSLTESGKDSSYPGERRWPGGHGAASGGADLVFLRASAYFRYIGVRQISVRLFLCSNLLGVHCPGAANSSQAFSVPWVVGTVVPWL